jgi:hypothetical protein
MGNCIQKKRQIIIQNKLMRKIVINNVNFSFLESVSIMKFYDKSNLIVDNKIEKISLQMWINILNYLTFNELKETGKVNKFFNQTVKRKEILVKFFKKRDNEIIEYNDKKNIENIYLHTIINNFISFSILQNNNSLIQNNFSFDSIKNC